MRFAFNRDAKAFRFLVNLPKLTKLKACASGQEWGHRNGVSHHFVLDVRRGIDCYTISIPFGQIDALRFQS